MFINTPLGKIYIWTYHKLIEDIYEEDKSNAGEKYEDVKRLTLEDLYARVQERESGDPKNILNDILDVAFLNFFTDGEEIADVYLHLEGFFYRYVDKGQERFMSYTYDDFIKFHYLKETFVFSDEHK